MEAVNQLAKTEKRQGYNPMSSPEAPEYVQNCSLKIMSNYYLSKCCDAQVNNCKYWDGISTKYSDMCSKCNNDCEKYPVIDKN